LARWPKGAKVAVCLTGDVDSPYDLVNGRLERVFEVLDDYQLKYTFFITAQFCGKILDSIKEMISHGDEIAGHGDVHEAFRGQSYEEQRKRMERMIRVIREVCGVKINGFRAPKLKGDIISSKVADELGLSYDSSYGTVEAGWINLKGEFIKIKRKKLRHFLINCIKVIKLKKSKFLTRPFLKGVGGFMREEYESGCLPFHPIYNGQQLDILAIPFSEMDDYYLIEKAHIKNWKKIAEIWKSNFDDHYERNDLHVLLAHPVRVGKKEYIKALRSFVEYAIGKGDVWFATLSELTTWWKARENKLPPIF